MLKKIKSTLFFFLLLLSLSSTGQIFPVQVTTQLARPYSLFLSDYTAPGSERVTVNIFLTDISRTDLNIRLRLRIEGQGIKIETKPDYVPPMLTVQGGTPLQLISADLADYFNPRNLNFTGISQREYQQKGALPEGLYQFCFEVYEYNRNVKISNSSCASAWLILNDPPLINLPRDNEKIRIQNPQQVIFQWTPRHTGSPNSAFTTEYDFKLVEVWPSTRNPNDAILTSPPIYETTTTSTTLIYGPAETALEPGRRYAFQVKARSMAGVNELNLFKNNGLSQVGSFVFGDACVPPQNIVADVTGSTQFTASWDAGESQTAYNVRYRVANGGEWYTNNTINPDIEIKSLQPSTSYEYQVSATCGILESKFSPVATLTTKASPPIAYSCGVPLIPFNLDRGQLLDVLKVGDVIQAGDFDVNVTKVTGGNGSFSGEGVIQVSYFNQAKVKAEFSNITVNKEMRMVDGYLNVTGAGVEVIPSGVLDFMDKLSEGLALLDSAITKYEENLPKRFDPTVFVADKLIAIPVAIVSVTPATDGSGAVVIVDDKGNKQTVPAGTSVAITDSKGKGYIVDKNGGIHETTAAIAAKAGKREYNLTLKFAPAADQTFGFDELGQKTPLANTYDKIDGKYDVAWKSVATGQTDKVQAILEASGIDKSKVRFEQFGQPLTPSESETNNAISFSVHGRINGTTEGVVALYTPGDTTKKEQVLGQLNVVTYNEIPKTVVIVPVNDADGSKIKKVGDKLLLQTELNKIYGQAVVEWTVTFGENITVPGIEPFEDGGTGLLSNYTSHMRQVIRAYKANMEPNTYYLFLVSNPKDPGTLGIMPRSKESGFIFVDRHADAAAIARTMAHELGHGAFNLQHTFSEPNLTQAKGSTDNLMDYPAGDKLYKYQWDKMRYPDIVMGLFEEDEEAMMHGDPTLSLINWEESKSHFTSKIFVEPGGRAIDLKNGDPYKFYSDEDSDPALRGTLHSFNVNGQLFVAYIKASNGTYVFAGYAPANINSKDFYKYKFTPVNGDVTQKQLVKINANCEVTIIQNGIAKEPFKISTCKSSMVLSGFAKSFYDHHSATVGIDQEALRRVSQIVSEMGEDFYKKYLPDATSLALTNENLAAMEKSLRNVVEVQTNLYGSAGLVNFEKLITFLTLCYDDYKKQLDDKSTHDIVPRCIWKDQTNTVYYTSVDLAFSAGIIDGAWAMIMGLVDLANFVDCWTPISPTMRFWFDDGCTVTRQKTKDFFSAMGGITEGDNMSAFGSAVGNELSSYLSSLAGISPENRHQQGKLVFDVASLFIGVGEANAVVKGAKITETTAAFMQKFASLISKIKLPPSLILKTQKLATATIITITLSTATVTADVAKVVPRATGVIEYVIKMGDNVATALPKVTEAVSKNSGKIAETATKTEQSILRFTDKAEKVYDLGTGKYFATDVGDFIIMSVEANNQILNVQAIEKATATVFILGSLAAGSQPDDSGSDCAFCLPSRKISLATCEALQALQAKTSNAAGVQQLCREIFFETNLKAVADKLNSYTSTDASAFLSDIIGKPNDPTEALSKNVMFVDVEIVEAWKAMTAAANAGTAFARDFVLLQKIKDIRVSTAKLNLFNYGTIGNFQAFLRAYNMVPCNTCPIPTPGSLPSFFPGLDEILDNTVASFEQHSVKTGFPEFYSREPFSRDNTYGKDGGQHMLKYLADNSFTANAISFDQNFSTGNFRNRQYDIYLGPDAPVRYIECKSYQEETELNTAKGVEQFLGYLSQQDLTNLNQLRYVFNAKKLTLQQAKEKMKTVLTGDRANDIFNTIWTNTGLRVSTFPNAANNPQGRTEALNDFVSWSNDLNSPIYNFVITN